MAAELIKIVDTVRDDMKALYLKNPTTIWDLPIVALSRKSGGVSILDNIKSNEQAIAWLQGNLDKLDLDCIVVGRMVAKYSDVLDSDGKPIIKEKALMVMGRQLSNMRSYVSITPCREHRDYRCEETAERQDKTFNPTIQSADLRKNIVDEETNRVVGRLTARFEPEQKMDSQKGDLFVMDPLIEGICPTPRGTGTMHVEDGNKTKVEDIQKILKQ